MLSPLSAILFFCLSTPSEFGFGIGLGYAPPCSCPPFLAPEILGFTPQPLPESSSLMSESNTAAVVGNLPAIRQMRTECFPSPFSNDFLLCRSKWGEKETKIRCGARETNRNETRLLDVPARCRSRMPKKAKKILSATRPLRYTFLFHCILCFPLSHFEAGQIN